MTYEKPIFFENDAHWSAQTRGYWVFQDYRFFVPTVFLLFTNDCWFISENRDKKCILYLFLLKIHSLLNSELYATNCILSASALVLLDNIVVADPS